MRGQKPTREAFLEAIRQASVPGENLTWTVFNRATKFHSRVLKPLGFANWNEAKEQAGLAATPPGKPKKWTASSVIEAIKAMYDAAQRPLAEEDFESWSPHYPGFSMRVVNDNFERLSSALQRAGVPGTRRMGVDRQTMVEELAALAATLNRTPLQDEVVDHGLPSGWAYANVFGSWATAVRAAGLTPLREELPARATLVAELQDLRESLGRVPVSGDLDERRWRVWTYFSVFGSWNGALIEAGLHPTKTYGIPTAALTTELQRVASSLGSTPSIDQMNAAGAFHAVTYIRRFGSWNMAVREAGLEPNTEALREEADVRAHLVRLDAASSEPLTLDEVSKLGVSPKTIVRIFGNWGAARRELGLKIGREHTVPLEDLLNDLVRISEGAGAGYSMKAYVDRGGRFHPSTYVRACGGWNEALRGAGLKPVRRLDVLDKELIAEFQRVARHVQRTPLRDDLVQHGIFGPSLYYLRFETLCGAAEAAGLEPNRQYAQQTDGEDGHSYDSAAEARVANTLFDLQNEGLIAGYEPHVAVGEAFGRKWTVDFEVERTDGTVVHVEYDGMGPTRAAPYSSDGCEKLLFLREQGTPLIVVTSYAAPIFGIRVTMAALRSVLSASASGAGSAT